MASAAGFTGRAALITGGSEGIGLRVAERLAEAGAHVFINGRSAERAWLAEKYPTWEQVYGDKWDVIIDNGNNNNMEATLPETLPWLCSTCHLPACNATQSRNGTWRVRDIQLSYDGRIYHFCTNGCRQIFWKDRDNVNHETLIDRFLAGQIQPMDVGGILGYMGLTPEVMGDDPDYEAWTRDYAGRPADGIAPVARS